MRTRSWPGTVVTGQGRAHCLLPMQTLGPASRGAQRRLRAHPWPGCHPLLPPLLPVTLGTPSDLARGSPGAGCRSDPLTAHLAQMCEHCPVSTHHGMKVWLFSSSPVTHFLAGLRLCPLVRYSEAQGQWSDIRAGQCLPVFPNMMPALSPCSPYSPRTGRRHCLPEHCRTQFVTSGQQWLDLLLLEGSQLFLVHRMNLSLSLGTEVAAPTVLRMKDSMGHRSYPLVGAFVRIRTSPAMLPHTGLLCLPQKGQKPWAAQLTSRCLQR